MSDYQMFVKEILDSYKCKSPNDYLICLPVYNENNEIKAYLRPITKNYLETIPDCVDFMGRWRAENPTLSSGKFIITCERTRHWLDNNIINNDNRILFLIMDFYGNYIGHIGINSFDFDEQAAEVDAAVRGVKGVIPGVMQFSMKTIVEWAQNVLKVKRLTGRTGSDNTRSINFHLRCGYKTGELIPMVKVVLPDEERWEVSPDPDLKNAEKYDIRILYTDKV